ncbi:hypothetical protein JSO19_03075 [Leucobacter sp. UCMA 4100]|uniref:hypothetical protein n=1 Tax=Leucobacter sp. UCMA 4100 TaxID=2810534 RepID=UPI0022EA5940|nr:hypothetical protein [Leucobacter sp. UCMA 4100]MDA3146357.1 hypothetical protein [Leucobacter sp. UCMA 4100]
MKLGKAALIGVVLSVVMILAGALVITFTEFGILGFTLILLGICLEIYAISRPRHTD